ncbi:MAG TPA: 4Fe-4S binding protein [Candidatus Polarisedimenticolia bacterium]|nr:4Fe-4S binding protein [Candidatus Polarisedimenticolia bacterium]
MPQAADVVLEGLAEVEGWEARWLARKDQPDDPYEAERRKGRIYELTEEADRFLVTVLFPNLVPNHPLKYRHGMPEAMPDYKVRLELADNVLTLHASMDDPVVSRLCDIVPDFPRTFSIRFDMTEPVKTFAERYWNKMMVVQLPKAASAEDALGAHRALELEKAAPVPADNPGVEWRAHYITSECVGCSICDIKCPTHAISGRKKEMYVIEPELCINCGVCGIYCPYDAIVDQHGDLVKRIKAKDIPKAVVIPELCSGCEYCIDTCPFDCISLVPAPNADAEAAHMSSKVAFVDEKTCVSCGICETFCIKEAIIVDRKFNWNDQIGFSYQEGRLVPTPELPETTAS